MLVRRFGLALKSANNSADGLATGNLEAQRSLSYLSPSTPGAAGSEGVSARIDQYTQQTRFAGGKNFFQNGNQWMDSLVQKTPNAKKIRIQFNSTEYFELIAKNSKALPWLALGQNVQFVLADTVYEIFE